MFDRDAGGTIDPKELHDIVHGLFCLAGMEVPDEILDIRSKVNLIPQVFLIVKLGSRSKVYLISLIRDLDLELDSIIAIAMPPLTTNSKEGPSCLDDIDN